MDTGKQLYDAAVQADKDFQDVLEEEYGSKAHEMRYSYVLPSAIAIIRLRKLEADAAWLKFMREPA